MKDSWKCLLAITKHTLAPHPGSRGAPRPFQFLYSRGLHTAMLSNLQAAIKQDAGRSTTGGNPWKEAASLLLVAPMNNSEPYSLGYLMLERSRTSRVQPGSLVFPGGNVDPVDSNPVWIDMFKDIQQVDLSQQRFFQDGAHIPAIYRSDSADSPIPKEVSLRITAIRETFEEAGVLLCKPRSIADLTKSYYEFPQLEDRNEVKAWQKKIRKDSKEFIELCKQLDCVPDIHKLHDWNNWLTPTIMKSRNRFDTIFYMIMLPTLAHVTIDGHEATKAQWASPSSILNEYGKGLIKLVPPQMYEISRLVSSKTFADLEHKIQLRKKLGIERYMPVVKVASDATLFTLPGDDLYPASPDYLGTDESPIQEIAKTVSQLKEESKNVHRGIGKGDGTLSGYDINVTRYGHIY